MQKIAIIGAHSVGKTTLAYVLSAYYKMKDLNVKLIHESVRENCPFPINTEANQGTCLWNFHTQFLNELEAEAQGYQLAICDRSVLDTFVYFHAVNPESHITRAALEQASQWMTTYDVLICLSPIKHVALYDDGIRSTDKEYQHLINKGFERALQVHCAHIEHRTISANSDDVFNVNARGKLIQEIDEKMQALSPLFL